MSSGYRRAPLASILGSSTVPYTLRFSVGKSGNTYPAGLLITAPVNQITQLRSDSGIPVTTFNQRDVKMTFGLAASSSTGRLFEIAAFSKLPPSAPADYETEAMALVDQWLLEVEQELAAIDPAKSLLDGAILSSESGIIFIGIPQ